jgi:aspartyl-tRNA(Asn)/glutamyl-tRNA(Gln) amidotransferase subunit A
MNKPISIVEAAGQIRKGQLTPLDVVDGCLEVIHKFDDRLNAWVVVDEEGARKAAHHLGEEAARGEYRSLLHGIPIGIKDIIDVEGFATRAGSPLRGNHRAEADAPVVAALRQAGAIILGKTVTVEFACFDPPPTRNPWHPALRHTPGGSSSGSAVAVAMGMCLGALGTQTGGSLVRPSSYCGIATCKPTFGQVSSEGIVPVSHHLDHPGPMARTVDDLAILLSHLPRPARFGWPGPGPQTLAQSSPEEFSTAPHPPRLGLVEEWFLDEADPVIQQATATAVEKLRLGGARVETVKLPEGFGEILPLHRRIMAVEAATYHREQFIAHRQSYGPMITALLDEGLNIRAVAYAAALAHQRDFWGRIGSLFEGFDALIMPSTETTAPATLATTGNNCNQAPWSYLGVPVISIPCGRASNGMPAAVQLVTRHYGERELFPVARWCENCLNFDSLPSLLAS